MSVWWRASPLPASVPHLGTVCYSGEASSPGKGAHRFRVPDFQRTEQTLQSPRENEGFLTGSGCGEGGGVNQRRVLEEVLPETCCCVGEERRSGGGGETLGRRESPCEGMDRRSNCAPPIWGTRT